MGKRLLMILSPYVFLHTSREAPVPSVDSLEISTVHWIPLNLRARPSSLRPSSRVAPAALTRAVIVLSRLPSQ